MSEFNVRIDCDNRAFCEDDGTPSEEARGAEVARILRDLADQVENGYTAAYLVDAYGNNAGFASFKG